MSYDKCCICLWKGLSEETEIEHFDPELEGFWYEYKCPNCGSEDLEDINNDPYEEEDEDDEEGDCFAD